MGYMVEFSRLGISNKLNGTDGLYYLVRRELRDDQLNASLDQISNKLDIIIDQNHEVYSEIISMNQQCDKIVSSVVKNTNALANTNKTLKSISENSAIAAYNSQRTAIETKYTNYMLIWDQINKGI